MKSEFLCFLEPVLLYINGYYGYFNFGPAIPAQRFTIHCVLPILCAIFISVMMYVWARGSREAEATEAMNEWITGLMKRTDRYRILSPVICLLSLPLSQQAKIHLISGCRVLHEMWSLARSSAHSVPLCCFWMCSCSSAHAVVWLFVVVLLFCIIWQHI